MPIDEVRPRKDKRGVDLISDALPFQAVIWLVCARGVATLSEVMRIAPRAKKGGFRFFVWVPHWRTIQVNFGQNSETFPCTRARREGRRLKIKALVVLGLRQEIPKLCS